MSYVQQWYDSRMDTYSHLKFKVDKTNFADLTQLHDLERLLFPDPWPVDALVTTTLSPKYQNILVSHESSPKRIIAYAIIERRFGAEMGLAKIGVDRQHQGVGLGRQLMDYVIEFCRNSNCDKLSLRVRQSNNVAINLYESLGFKKSSVVETYYSTPTENAYHMVKTLS